MALTVHNLILIDLAIYNLCITVYYIIILYIYRKITFSTNNTEERRQAAEKVISESEQIAKSFQQLVPDMVIPEEHKKVLPDLAEILKMGDTAMMPLELSVSPQLVENNNQNYLKLWSHCNRML